MKHLFFSDNWKKPSKEILQTGRWLKVVTRAWSGASLVVAWAFSTSERPPRVRLSLVLALFIIIISSLSSVDFLVALTVSNISFPCWWLFEIMRIGSFVILSHGCNFCDWVPLQLSINVPVKLCACFRMVDVCVVWVAPKTSSLKSDVVHYLT